METFNFQQAVLEKSFEKPVLVDFWAPWCGPCRILGPVLEALAQEQRDRWELVKINTEEEEALAYEYQIRSIPNVKLFYQGNVLAEFAGALPRPAIIKWLDEHLPDDRRKTLETLLERLQEGNPMAPSELAGFVAENPDMPEPRIALAKYLVLQDATQALELSRDIPIGHPLYDDAQDVRTIAGFLTEKLAGESPAAGLLESAREAIQEGDYERAIQQLIEAVTTDRDFLDGLPRKTAIAFFRTWGPQHHLTKNYRWRFDMALY